jgi:hypothetical protein
MDYKYDYKFNYQSKNFSKAESWNFTIDGVSMAWTPLAPFIISDDSDVEAVNNISRQIAKFIDTIGVDENNLFLATTTGPELFASTSAPYTVLYAIYEIYSDELDLVSFSPNAPKISDFNQEDDLPENESEVVY